MDMLQENPEVELPALKWAKITVFFLMLAVAIGSSYVESRYTPFPKSTSSPTKP